MEATARPERTLWVRCPSWPPGEARGFEAMARAIEPITPRMLLEQPGTLLFPTRGPSRYFGGDYPLTAQVLHQLRSVGVADARVGVADGRFAARLAARAAPAGTARVVEPGVSAAFLAPWPVGLLSLVAEDGAELASLLVRLGLPTLGDLAALPSSAVLARFGAPGARAYRLACGLEEPGPAPGPPPPDLVETCELDPPATRVDEAAFVAKALADRLLARLAALGLSCADVVVEAETEHGERLARRWRHQGALTPTALATRVRWQLDGWLAEHHGGPTGGLVLVRLVPAQVLPATGRQLGFWGGDAAAGDRADRCFARLQGMLGHDAVVTAMPTGGRTPAEQVRLVSWGDPRDPRRDVAKAPWPGTVPGPAPARVFTSPLAAELLDHAGHAVVVSGRGDMSAPPVALRCAALPGGGGPVLGWAGPWVHDLRWWDRRRRRRRALWQVVVASGDVDGGIACLVDLERGRAGIEAVYD